MLLGVITVLVVLGIVVGIARIASNRSRWRASTSSDRPGDRFSPNPAHAGT
jgi:hypothetical protein